MSKTVMGSETEYGIFMKHAADGRMNYVQVSALLKKCPLPHFRRNLSLKWTRKDGDFQITADTMNRLLAGHLHLTAEDRKWLAEHFDDISLGNYKDALLGETGLQLENGSRFYIDCSHPELSTPEVTNAHDLVAYEKAGEWIVEATRAAAFQEFGQEVRIYKNNSDGKASSYACHENYLVSSILFNRLTGNSFSHVRPLRISDEQEILLAFFATRQIMCGAGKIGIEATDRFFAPAHPAVSRVSEYSDGEFPAPVRYEDREGRGDCLQNDLPRPDPYVFQISQRADFFVQTHSLNTTNHRGMINTRDRSYAHDPDLRRFHVIIGDSNMAEWSIFLKVGTTALVLDLLSSDEAVEKLKRFTLKDPVKALRDVSLDLTCRSPEIELQNGEKVSALEIQKEFLSVARLHHKNKMTPVEAKVLRRWQYALWCFEHDPSRLDDKLDWRIKKNLFDHSLKKHGATWENCGERAVEVRPGVRENLGYWLKQLDLEYSNTNPEKGIYHFLLKKKRIKRIVSEREVGAALSRPPSDTRAHLRGMLVKHCNGLIKDMHWHFVELHGVGRVNLDPFDGTKEVVDALLKHFTSSPH